MADKDDEKDEAAKAATEAKKVEEQRFNDIANRAAADHAKRLTAKFEKALEDRDAKIAALVQENEELRKKPADGGGKQPEPEGLAGIRKEFEARLAERDRKLEEERKARESERAARLADEERAAAMSALGEMEISGELQRAAFLRLREEKLIGRDGQGGLVFKVQKDGYVDEVPLRDGIKAWAETPTGKAYQAPKGVQGSGNRPAPGPRSPAKTSRAERVAEARAALAEAFGMGQKA